jgi:hypothetical protein
MLRTFGPCPPPSSTWWPGFCPSTPPGTIHPYLVSFLFRALIAVSLTSQTRGYELVITQLRSLSHGFPRFVDRQVVILFPVSNLVRAWIMQRRSSGLQHCRRYGHLCP